MTIEDRTKLRNIAVRLQITLDELKELENTTEDLEVQQVALSTEMALAWIDLVHQFDAERKSPRGVNFAGSYYILINPFRRPAIAASVRLRAPNFCMMLFT